MSKSATRVLVVEDEALVAMTMCDDLAELGCRIVGPYGDLGRATQAAMSEAFDIALVDINLNSKMSYPLVDWLIALKVPTALVTAYDQEGIPDRFKRLLLMAKPYSLSGLTSLLSAMGVKVG